ncbi:hypothetical protein BC828DRAFT_394650 [Blastocladiella britannica]|nr:hypothetical protein BC828DRAFT_394650 [Blastocladiella britannica]
MQRSDMTTMALCLATLAHEQIQPFVMERLTTCDASLVLTVLASNSATEVRAHVDIVAVLARSISIYLCDNSINSLCEMGRMAPGLRDLLTVALATSRSLRAATESLLDTVPHATRLQLFVAFASAPPIPFPGSPVVPAPSFAPSPRWTAWQCALDALLPSSLDANVSLADDRKIAQWIKFASHARTRIPPGLVGGGVDMSAVAMVDTPIAAAACPVFPTVQAAYGAWVTARLALVAPDRVAALATMCSAATPTWLWGLRAAFAIENSESELTMSVQSVADWLGAVSAAMTRGDVAAARVIVAAMPRYQREDNPVVEGIERLAKTWPMLASAFEG